MNDYVRAYLKWLKENMTQTTLPNGIIEITTPFLDRNNDYTQIYISECTGGYKISDGGYILSDLAISGMDVSGSASRKKIFNRILNRLGLKVGENDEILAYANDENQIPATCHRVIQGMIDVNDMFYISTPNVRNLFFEDVHDFNESL